MTQNQPISRTCKDSQTLLEEYIAGELDSQTESAITSHLTTCDRCQHELHLAQTIGKVLDDLPKPTSPPDVLAEVTAYVRANPKSEGWLHHLFQFPGALDFLRSPLLRASALACLMGMMFFGIYQYHKYVEVEQAKSDFQYAMSKMQSAVRKTSLAVNDSFTSLNVDKAPRRALKPTVNISPAIQQSLDVLNILTGSDTIKPNSKPIKPNNQIQGETTQ